ncbi:tRNA (adenosine(37)-N6)-dimethylallyltransferase MiaA [Capillimicrobium parvum]|uniref:tRNA dimethylallyltransferase n=1 Tax=Capillimicrobium parvum TaxID=2884022 RepID=A0A9E6XY56_9ACTN|nr:tRNA (adenosine(37)-N6)-dimethylallyltransferase MiaA [Capillimicrobium parvum]UGS36662.1 tRNA dimethylallyltransferase [Capillimicrobium parvum]
MATPTILAVFGPTGAGKTALAIALAQRLRSTGDRPVAVSADALQVYAGLETLTGVATPAERARLEHRLVSFVPVDARFSVAEHARLAHAEIDGLLHEGRTPIVVGGTGLYLRAALAELDLRPAAPDEIRAAWMDALARDGAPALHAELRRRAPWAAAGVDPNDAHRVVRLLELSDLGELEPPDGTQRPNQLWTEHTRHPTRLIGVTMDREALYARIEARVDAMVAAGAIEEVRAANAAGASETARKALGFDDLLAGDIDAMKRRTRNYAKRQLTWMRKLPGVEMVDLTRTTPEDAAAGLLGGRDPGAARP